ncbi:hypothetical protein Tco_0350689, partial [Tanacetum coccineum]
MRAECRGLVPIFGNGPGDSGLVTMGGEQYKDLLWRCATATTVQRFGKNMEEIKKFDPKMYKWLKDIPHQHWARKWEITGMPCKHAVACIWDMANNGLEPG